MTPPKVSVIIPAYNQADYLGEAIESVLNQSYHNFELIVVNDASPDHTEAVVKRYNDARLKYLVHQKNRHLAAARNTGIRASSGEIIALLDADDIFHPDKLAHHVEFLETHPEVGVTYNSRFDIDPNGNTLNIWHPPPTVSLEDLVKGFPFAPSDMTLRRRWAFAVNLFDESYVFFSEDLDINCRLALRGCQFANVKGILNYRRYYPAKIIKNVPDRLDAALTALEKTFSDPRCPASISALRPTVFGNKHMIWSYEAFIQNNTSLAQNLLNKAIAYEPAILSADAKIFHTFLTFRVNQDGSDPEPYLTRVFKQLPPKLEWITKDAPKTIAAAYLIKGVRQLTWDQPEQGLHSLERALAFNIDVDREYADYISYHLATHEAEFGRESGRCILSTVNKTFTEAGAPHSIIRQINSLHSINNAFKAYHQKHYDNVPGEIIKATLNNPVYIINRGVLSILFRSLFKITRKNFHKPIN